MKKVTSEKISFYSFLQFSQKRRIQVHRDTIGLRSFPISMRDFFVGVSLKETYLLVDDITIFVKKYLRKDNHQIEL